MIPVFERAKTVHASDRSTTVIDTQLFHWIENCRSMAIHSRIRFVWDTFQEFTVQKYPQLKRKSIFQHLDVILLMRTRNIVLNGVTISERQTELIRISDSRAISAIALQDKRWQGHCVITQLGESPTRPFDSQSMCGYRLHVVLEFRKTRFHCSRTNRYFSVQFLSTAQSVFAYLLDTRFVTSYWYIYELLQFS
jgi:hypothetical protein